MASDSSKSPKSALPTPGSAVDPSTLDIMIYPKEVLRKKAKPLDMGDPQVRANVRAVAERMIEMMYDLEGIGLAAPQVGLPWRMFVVDIEPAEPGDANLRPSTCTDGPAVYINPVLSSPRGDLEPSEEGCLSLPKVRGDVIRPTTINITALDLDGKPFSVEGTGLLARCWQHETDHLDGVLILDKLTQAARLKNRVAIRNLEQNA